MGHASLEPGGSDSLGLKESLCVVAWRWLDQSSSAGAATEGINRVKEAVSLSGWI